MSKLTEHKAGSLQGNPTKRKKTDINNGKQSDRKWSAMEILCILELIVHKDVRTFYKLNPSLDASLFNTQDWHEISEWMTSYFSKSQSYWFDNYIKPKIPYTPIEIKNCAVRIITKHNNNILPKKFDILLSIVDKIKKIYNQNAIKILDKNKNIINNKIKQMQQSKIIKPQTPKKSVIKTPVISTKNTPVKVISKSNTNKATNKPITPTNTTQNISKIQLKTDINTCKKHLMSMLKKLSQYNDKTQTTMRKKLEDKYSKLFDHAKHEYNATKLKTEEKKLLQQKDKDWQQYKQTIANKVSGSWKENVIKLQNKFGNIIVTVIPQVKTEYLQQNPNDKTIKLLLATPLKGISNGTAVNVSKGTKVHSNSKTVIKSNNTTVTTKQYNKIIKNK